MFFFVDLFLDGYLMDLYLNRVLPIWFYQMSYVFFGPNFDTGSRLQRFYALFPFLTLTFFCFGAFGFDQKCLPRVDGPCTHLQCDPIVMLKLLISSWIY